MNYYPFILIVILASFFFTGCISCEDIHNREKALVVIRDDISKSIRNYDTYEPVETTIEKQKVDISVLYKDTLVVKLIESIKDADYNISVRYEDEQKARRVYKHSYSYPRYDLGELATATTKLSHARSATSKAEHERGILVDSILSIVGEQDDSKLGWKVKHFYSYKGEDGVPKFCYSTYYLDKDCNRIVLKINETSTHDNDIEFAYKIYEEAISRKECDEE